MTSLEEKLAARAGRLQLLVAALARMAHDTERNSGNLPSHVDHLLDLAQDYGASWLDETSDLLKEQYNRKAGG